MIGLVTTRTVLRHAATVLSCYGLRCFLRCLRAGLLHERVTFLSIAWSLR